MLIVWVFLDLHSSEIQAACQWKAGFAQKIFTNMKIAQGT
jgi:hypothetical protein